MRRDHKGKDARGDDLLARVLFLSSTGGTFLPFGRRCRLLFAGVALLWAAVPAADNDV